MQQPHSSFSIVVPVLDEAAGIAAALADLAPLRQQGAEIVVVDGGSRDDTRALAAPFADRLVDSPRGRALQMNAGARAARGAVLVFLHADTRLPAAALEAIASGLERTGRAWGRFDVDMSGHGALLLLVAAMMNLRSRVSGVATGDQAMFVRRDAFEAAGGFPAIGLMEDVALSKILKRGSPPLCLRERVVTSARRWERHGTLRTIALMWRLRLAYALGADPQRLARRYDVDRPAS
jgi:rSAM/selenodomain-associated transferase 2